MITVGLIDAVLRAPVGLKRSVVIAYAAVIALMLREISFAVSWSARRCNSEARII